MTARSNMTARSKTLAPSAPSRALFSVLLPALLVVAAPALAQRAERNDKNLSTNCAGDYFRYCGNIAPDSPEIDRCFERNWQNISQACRTAIDARDDKKATPRGKKS